MLKKILFAVLWALGATAVSVAFLTLAKGKPTAHQLVTGGVQMFIVAFLLFMLYPQKKDQVPDNKDKNHTDGG